MASDKDTRALLRKLRRAGFTVEMTSGGHWRVSHPDERECVIQSRTACDPRAFSNFKCQLKRAFGERYKNA